MGPLQERVAYLEGKVEDIRDLLTELNRRVDRIEQRIDRVEHRIDGLDEKMSRQFLWLVGIQITTLIAVVGAVLSRG